MPSIIMDISIVQHNPISERTNGLEFSALADDRWRARQSDDALDGDAAEVFGQRIMDAYNDVTVMAARRQITWETAEEARKILFSLWTMAQTAGRR